MSGVFSSGDIDCLFVYGLQASGGGLPEKRPHVEFFFKKFGAAICIAQIFRCVAARADLHAYRAALKRGVDAGDALAMRMIERFRDAQNGSQAASHALIVVIQRRIRDVMAGRLGLSVVIPHERGHNSAVAALQTWNISIEREVYAVLVRSEEHTSELQSQFHLVCRLLLE